jgi:23S rRNA (pseudouridine1915-N3)-methyltransferase
MRIIMLAVGERMPSWVDDGFTQYARRMPRECRLELREISAGRRAKGADIARVNRDEGERILSALPPRARFIALDRTGTSWSTEELAKQMGDWLAGGDDIAMAIGGPEGLSKPCLDAAESRWSLSRLTFAHPVARVVVAEQIYRAWSLLRGLPYHRA